MHHSAAAKPNSISQNRARFFPQIERGPYLLRGDGDPDAQAEAGESDEVGEDLRAGVHPDQVAEGEEPHGEGAEREEYQEG